MGPLLNATRSVVIMVSSTMATRVYHRMHAPEEVGRLPIAWPPAHACAVTRGTLGCENLERAHFGPANVARCPCSLQ